MVGLDAGVVRARRGPHQGRLPRRPIRPPQTAARAQEGTRRGQALDHLRLLAHAHHRRALQRPPAATTSNAATQSAKPNGSSNASKRLVTSLRSNQRQRQRPTRWRQPERYFPVRNNDRVSSSAPSANGYTPTSAGFGGLLRATAWIAGGHRGPGRAVNGGDPQPQRPAVPDGGGDARERALGRAAPRVDRGSRAGRGAWRAARDMARPAHRRTAAPAAAVASSSRSVLRRRGWL